MTTKRPLPNNKPELDIDNMSMHGEIIKQFIDEKATLTFEISVKGNKTEAAITAVGASDFSKFNKAWDIMTTKNFVLKLVALLDKQAKYTSDLSTAMGAACNSANDTVQATKEAWGLIK